MDYHIPIVEYMYYSSLMFAVNVLHVRALVNVQSRLFCLLHIYSSPLDTTHACKAFVPHYHKLHASYV